MTEILYQNNILMEIILTVSFVCNKCSMFVMPKDQKIIQRSFSRNMTFYSETFFLLWGFFTIIIYVYIVTYFVHKIGIIFLFLITQQMLFIFFLFIRILFTKLYKFPRLLWLLFCFSLPLMMPFVIIIISNDIFILCYLNSADLSYNINI